MSDFIKMSSNESDWEPFFAWYPVRVHGERAWFKEVYRRKIFWNAQGVCVDPPWQYGTLLDVLA